MCTHPSSCTNALPLPQLEYSPHDVIPFPILYHLLEAALCRLSERRWSPLTEDPAHLGSSAKMI